MRAAGSAVGLRAADADRDACIDQLQEHFVAGRLESWELDDRVGQALRARTQSDLDALLADCQSRPDAARPRWPGRWIAASVAAVVMGGLGVAVWSGVHQPEVGQATQVDWSPTVCDTTGVALPDGVDCPEMTVRQEQLNEDADRAIAAAEQLREVAAGWEEDAEMQSLLGDANDAAEKAQEAKADAQLLVATRSDGKIDENALREPAGHARDAAAEASRAVIRANRIVNR